MKCWIGILLLATVTTGFGQLDFLKKAKELVPKGPARDALEVAPEAGRALKGVTGIGLEEELVIGGSVAVEIVSKYGGLLRDEAVTKRVNLIGKTLANYCSRPELNFRFGVLNSASVNAFSAPGGYVFISKGLYDLAENDEQLAGVLAHEIAHITERHALKIIARGELLGGLAGIAATTGKATSQKDMAMLSRGVGDITATLFKGFDPATEFAADKVGSQLAEVTGYAKDGLKHCLESLEKKEAGGSKGGKSTLFPTHPPLKQRIEKLD